MKEGDPWSKIEKQLGVGDTTDEKRWKNALAVKLPSTLRAPLERLRTLLGSRGIASAIGQGTPWTTYGAEFAINGQSIKIINEDGSELGTITNGQLREILGLPPKISATSIFPGFKENPEPGTKNLQR